MGANFENYGGLKALCEQAAEAAFPGRAAIVRPGYIVGPGDPTDRFTYWPVRIARGGEVLAPGTPDDPVAVDRRARPRRVAREARRGRNQPERSTRSAPSGRTSGATCSTPASRPRSGKATLTWVPADWLEKNGQGGEDGFPIWVPPTGDIAGFHTWSNERARKAGLTFRPIADTVEATLAWYPSEIERRVRVTRELTEAAKAKGDRAAEAGRSHDAQGRPNARARSRAAREVEGRPPELT